MFQNHFRTLFGNRRWGNPTHDSHCVQNQNGRHCGNKLRYMRISFRPWEGGGGPSAPPEPYKPIYFWMAGASRIRICNVNKGKSWDALPVQAHFFKWHPKKKMLKGKKGELFIFQLIDLQYLFMSKYMFWGWQTCWNKFQVAY